MKSSIALAAILVTFLLSSCQKDPDLSPAIQQPAPPVPGTPTPTSPGNPTTTPGKPELVISFDAFVGNLPLIMDSTYGSFQGETFTVSKFKYYVSNIVLNGKNGSTFTEEESYHLVDHFEGRETFTLTGIPAGTYTSIVFLVGVDGRRNTTGAQTGDLDPAEQMFWDWNTGYIFYKLEGTYHSFSGVKGDYGFHVGGFSGPENALQQLTITPAQEVVVDSLRRVEIPFTVDVTEVFRTPHPMSFDTYYNQLGQPDLMRRLSENYRDMFKAGAVKYTSK